MTAALADRQLVLEPTPRAGERDPLAIERPEVISTSRVTFRIIRIVAAAIALAVVLMQCHKPRWWIGRFIVWVMNRSHSRLTDWGLSDVRIDKHYSILDVGCGGGRTIQKLAALATDGRVCGVDYSDASVAAARRTNAGAVTDGRVDILQGSVSQLPFPAATFDLVTAIETHYYWPSLVNDLREVRRVLKPGGRVVIVAETYRRTGLKNAVERAVVRLVGGTCLTVADHRNALTDAGFVSVTAAEERRRGWICVRGESPSH